MIHPCAPRVDDLTNLFAPHEPARRSASMRAPHRHLRNTLRNQSKVSCVAWMSDRFTGSHARSRAPHALPPSAQPTGASPQSIRARRRPARAQSGPVRHGRGSRQPCHSLRLPQAGPGPACGGCQRAAQSVGVGRGGGERQPEPAARRLCVPTCRWRSATDASQAAAARGAALSNERGTGSRRAERLRAHPPLSAACTRPPPTLLRVA